MFDFIKQNWKTTAAGLALIVVQALPYFNIILDPNVIKAITVLIGGGGLIIAQDPKKN